MNPGHVVTIDAVVPSPDTFADATSDHQWIHVDPERCARESPFGKTIAHGFLTLSLISTMFENAIRLVGAKMVLNYGTNKVRFPAAVPSGSRIRGRFDVIGVADPAFLADNDDLDVLLNGVKIARRILEAPPFRRRSRSARSVRLR